MKKSKVVVTIGLLLAGFMYTHVADAHAKSTSSRSYMINRLKTGAGESLVEYDFGSVMPHDDAYLKSYAQGSSQNAVSVSISTHLGNDAKSGTQNGGYVYRVAEVGGVDFITSGYGKATSQVGTASLSVK